MNEEKRLKEIRCSRCRKIKLVPSGWKFRECEFCHTRTNRKNLARRKVKKDLEKEIIEGLEGFESSYKDWAKYLKSCGKEPTQKTKEQFRKQWMEKQKTNKEKIEKIIQHFDSQIAPLQNTDCLRFRYLLEKRNEFLDTSEFANSLSEKDFKLFYNHKCESCSRYSAIYKNKEPDSAEEMKLKQEGYVGLAEWNQLMNQFNCQQDPDPYERGFVGMRDCCSSCGMNLVNGVCPNCQNYENQPDPQLSIGKEDPYKQQLEEQFKQQQEQQKPRGFVERLHERRNQNEEKKGN